MKSFRNAQNESVLGNHETLLLCQSDVTPRLCRRFHKGVSEVSMLQADYECLGSDEVASPRFAGFDIPIQSRDTPSRRSGIAFAP